MSRIKVFKKGQGLLDVLKTNKNIIDVAFVISRFMLE